MGENGTCAAQSAQDLLMEFQQTGQEAPFAEIARRYAGMVYNVALRVTHDAHDAEDATQATFLTLAVHAKTSGKIRFLGPWLKKVSHRLALDIRRSKKRRTAREQRHAAGNGAESNGNGHDLPVSNGLHTEELRHILREEIDRLPAKYRMPLILYYFGGLTPEEIGQQLHCNTSTLGVRLHRGRKMLAESLGSRGISMTAAIVAAVLAGMVDSFVKDNVVHATTSAAMQAGANGFAGANAASNHVLHLMRIATSALRYARLKAVVAVAVLMVSTFALGREALRHIDLTNSTLLQHLNPMRLIQPLLDRLMSRPQLSVQVDSPSRALHEIDQFPAGAQMPLSLSLADLDYEHATFSTPRGSGFSSSAISDVERSASPVIQSPAVISPPPTYAASSNHTTTPAYQVSTAVASRAPIAPAQLSVAPLVSVASSRSPGANPSFVMPGPNQPLIFDRRDGDVLFGGLPVSNFTLPNTTTIVPTVVIGDVTAGKLTQDSGMLRATQQVVIGNQPGSKGIYHVGGSAIVNSPTIIVGNAGAGTLTQTDGTVNAITPTHTGQVVLGAQSTGFGTYNLTGGTLSADTIIVGQQGMGEVSQDGGTASVTAVTIGADLGASGTWTTTSLSPILTSFPMDPATAAAMMDPTQSPAAPLVPTIVVGGSGTGNLLVQPTSPDSPAPIQEQPDAQGTSLVIRSDLTGEGTFSGAGVIQITGVLTMNGKIIADGNGSHQALDLSSASKVSNTIENAPNGGTNGWYAKNLGSLILPRIPINGTQNYTWGEDTLDDTIDLVNSVRFQPHLIDPNGPSGDAAITLYDPSDPSIPGLPGARRAIGLWGFDTTADLSGVDLVVRFDDQMADALDIPLANLGLWAFQDQWVQINDASFAIDLAQDLISGSVTGPFTYFAVGGLPLGAQPIVDGPAQQPATPGPASLGAAPTPEPGTALLTAAALGSLLSLRRSRRRRD